MPTKTFAELAKIRTQLARLHKRLKQLEARKLPVYWQLQPRIFIVLDLLEQLLRDDQQALVTYLPQPKK